MNHAQVTTRLDRTDPEVLVAAIPTTLSEKRLGVPLKRILAGADPERVASWGSLRDPAPLDAVVQIVGTRS
jgi:acetoacetyl-CoA synthetase